MSAKIGIKRITELYKDYRLGVTTGVRGGQPALTITHSLLVWAIAFVADMEIISNIDKDELLMMVKHPQEFTEDYFRTTLEHAWKPIE